MNEFESYCILFYRHMYLNPLDDQSQVWQDITSRYICPYSMTAATFQDQINEDNEEDTLHLIQELFKQRLLQLDKAQTIYARLGNGSRD